MSHTRFICCLTDDHPKVVELPATLEEIDDWQKGRKDIGVAMPQLSPAELDFLINGIYSDSLKGVNNGDS